MGSGRRSEAERGPFPPASQSDMTRCLGPGTSQAERQAQQNGGIRAHTGNSGRWSRKMIYLHCERKHAVEEET